MENRLGSGRGGARVTGTRKVRVRKGKERN